MVANVIQVEVRKGLAHKDLPDAACRIFLPPCEQASSILLDDEDKKRSLVPLLRQSIVSIAQGTTT